MAATRARRNAGCEVCEVQCYQAVTRSSEIGQRYSCHLLECTLIRRHRFVLPDDRMFNHAAPNYKNSHPLVITLRMFLHPDRTLGERIKKWRVERGLFLKELARMIGVGEMTIVDWEKGGIRLIKWNLEKLNKILETKKCFCPISGGRLLT